MEFKDILKRLEIPEKEHEDFIEGKKEMKDFNEIFDDKFIARDMVGEDSELVNSIFGKKIGETQTNISKGWNLTKSETKDFKIEDYIDLAIKKTGEEKQGLVDELNKLKENSSDDQLKDLQTEQEKWKEDKTKFEEDALEHNKEIVELKETHAGELKGFKLNSEIKAIEGRVEFHSEVNDMTKKGFMTTMKENYKIGFNDTDELEITDLKGNKIQNENKTENLSVIEVYDREATENKLLKGNQADPAKAAPSPTPTPDPNAQPQRKLHADTIKHEEELAN